MQEAIIVPHRITYSFPHHVRYGPVVNKNYAELLWDWTTSDAISFYTSLLAAFTLALVAISSIQIGYLIKADRTAARNADAALMSAEAALKSANVTEKSFVINSRPYIFLGTVNYVQPPNFDGGGYIEFKVENLGQTPATVTGLSIKCFVATAIEPTINETEAVNVPGLVHIGAGKEWGMPRFPVPQSTSGEVMSRLINGENIYFTGEISYKDVSGENYVSCFAVRASRFEGKQIFTAEGCEKYNYQRAKISLS
jgi:hypothetical protein